MSGGMGPAEMVEAANEVDCEWRLLFKFFHISCKQVIIYESCLLHFRKRKIQWLPIIKILPFSGVKKKKIINKYPQKTTFLMCKKEKFISK